VTAAAYSRRPEIDENLQLLNAQNEKVRMDAVLNLGKMKAKNAVDPVAATMAGDKSPQVRDAAARALGLIGSPRALTALKYAAQADSDRDVRHSAQFAIEVIQSDMKR
jgi:HEAT repeat protein